MHPPAFPHQSPLFLSQKRIFVLQIQLPANEILKAICLNPAFAVVYIADSKQIRC
ncbi:hypothetical protein CFter6_0150 [Collimonas fungivorans]|uniref:Uncharacterized protein n=1 Tax=Collimonas fungivorans TaxID=158899 RepID=A0A127P616_9BURK|nr:hypothetical protein CFter6_0150 [Collimonas fungivorans]